MPQKGQTTSAETKNNPLSVLTGIAQSEVNRIDFGRGILGGFLANAASMLLPELLNIGGYSKEITVESVHSGHDIFNGYRSGIALRSIDFVKVVYNTSGEFVSKNYKFGGLVETLTLTTQIDVPDGWDGGNLVKFYLSTDNGATWMSVDPQIVGGVNTSIRLKNPTNQVKVKIQLSSNSSDKTNTPRVRFYSIKGLPI